MLTSVKNFLDTQLQIQRSIISASFRIDRVLGLNNGLSKLEKPSIFIFNLILSLARVVLIGVPTGPMYEKVYQQISASVSHHMQLP